MQLYCQLIPYLPSNLHPMLASSITQRHWKPPCLKNTNIESSCHSQEPRGENIQLQLPAGKQVGPLEIAIWVAYDSDTVMVNPIETGIAQPGAAM